MNEVLYGKRAGQYKNLDLLLGDDIDDPRKQTLRRAQVKTSQYEQSGLFLPLAHEHHYQDLKNQKVRDFEV